MTEHSKREGFVVRRKGKAQAQDTSTVVGASAQEAQRAGAPAAASDPAPPPENYFDAAFLDNLAHQLIAPLQCIENHCQNILEGSVPPEKVNVRLREVVGHARITVSLAQRMRFLHQLVTNPEAHAQAEQVPFHKIVSQWIDGFNNYLPALKARGIGVDIHHPEMNRLPDVLATPLAVQQVIMNLYDNAAKYADAKSTIDISARQKDEFVEAVFRHPGVRVREDERERIFERGYRSPAVEKMRAPGTGVGLWVCRRLMRAMKGDIACVAQGLNGETEFRLSWHIAK